MSDAALFVRKKPISTEQITVSNVVVQLTAAKVANTANPEGGNSLYWKVTHPASVVVLELIGSNGIIFTLDGSTPSTTNGRRLLGAGDAVTIVGKQKISNLKMIRLGASDDIVDVTYFKD